jgi:hypothetical protein
MDLMDLPDACMCIADDKHIFDFNALLLWEKGSLEQPRNFSGAAQASELLKMRVPGDTGVYDCSIRATAGGVGGEIPPENGTQRACYARFAATCEDQLKLWRMFEQQKDVAKVFTAIFIMVGIGILGGVVGALGETLMECVHNLLGGVEYGRISHPWHCRTRVFLVNTCTCPLSASATNLLRSRMVCKVQFQGMV